MDQSPFFRSRLSVLGQPPSGPESRENSQQIPDNELIAGAAECGASHVTIPR